ncbi:MAG: cation transporter [Prochloron sp. SP5CPC1]|nr:cation transporter [Candidatus Paraprochloron terpiosi SP5CPC1]
MKIKFKVPSIACKVCGETITNGIKTKLPTAKVEVDVATKTVTVETTVSEDSIRKIITEVGHKME